MQKPAVLLIDMQEHFLKTLDEELIEPLVRAQKKVLRYCLSQRVEVGLIEYAGKGDTLAELDALVKKGNYFSIEKTRANAFQETDLRQKLNDRNISNIVCMGIYASGCVFATAYAAWGEYDIHICFDTISNALPGKKSRRDYEKFARTYDICYELMKVLWR